MSRADTWDDYGVRQQLERAAARDRGDRCALCGGPITAEDEDAIQFHGGAVGGLVHDSCLDHLQEAAEDLVTEES